MRRRLVIICCAMSLLCFVGCSRSGADQTVHTAKQEDEETDGRNKKTSAEEETQQTKSIFENEVKFYIMEADDDTTVTPAIELDGTDGTFMFLENVLLSANTQGTFEVQDNVVTATSDDGEKTYLFEAEDKDTLRFVQEGSSKVMLSDAENNEQYLADKAEFKIVENRMPSKEEVYAMRQKVLEGMTEEDKKTLTDNIKAANESLERSYLYDHLFERLSDPENLSWNVLEKTGEIQTGWAFEDGVEYDDSLGMTYEQFAKEYGEPVMTENSYDADALVIIVQEMKNSLKNNLLRDDLESIIQNIYQAKETHDVEYVKQIYYTVHDMDYFLLRYGMEDIAPHVSDMSGVSTYYGALKVYK